MAMPENTTLFITSTINNCNTSTGINGTPKLYYASPENTMLFIITPLENCNTNIHGAPKLCFAITVYQSTITIQCSRFPKNDVTLSGYTTGHG